ncbi:hypothetical protein F383_33541 [Gossypium arboreum]|uniref:Uncharacterized protein n=1 Tax=Gossypium arboreum TaxID=29729 RepID=A0A0B0PUD6_GOSAR|nr:hypothetical protein F383_33541 [Gossypium arboreum]
MVIHARYAKPVGFTDLCHTAKLHARV